MAKYRLLFGNSIFLLVWLMLISAVYAQTDNAINSKDIDLERITVTASRSARFVSESPMNVSVISAQEIVQSNAKSVVDVLKTQDGLYAYDPSGVGASGMSVNMRGFYGGMSSHYLVLVDGIPQNKGKDKLVDWDLISLDNVERIEIVRGPSSALYGDNAMSGLINIITRKPTKKPEGKFSVSYGSFDTQEYKVSTSARYKELGYSFGLSQKNSATFRRHCNYRRNHAGGELDYEINDTQKLQLLADYFGLHRGAYPWALSEAQISSDRRQARPGTENDKSDINKINASITHAWDIDTNLKTEGTFYYKYYNGDSFYTTGSTESTKREQVEGENTYGILLKGNLNEEIIGLAQAITTGIDLERDIFDYQEYSAPYQQRSALQQDYGVKRNKVGPYLQDEITLSRPFKLIAGLRYDWVDFDFNNRQTPANSKTEKMSKVTPRGSLVYSYRKNSTLYANYAQAFRTPTIGQMFTYGSSANPDLEPEEATSYEIGLHHFFYDSLKLDISLYWIKLNNEIWYDYASNKYQNYGKTTHGGVETSLELKIRKWLSGFLNYTYTQAKNKSGTYSGKYLTSVPVHKAGVGMYLVSDFGLSWNLVFNYLGNSYIDSANDNKLSGYEIVDTKISYKYKISKIFFAIDNLFDRRYNAYGYVSGNAKYFTPAAGRTFTGGVEIEF